MELLPLWLCLGFHLIAMEWKLRSGMAEAAFQGPCKLAGGVADCRGQNLASVPGHLPPASRALVLDDNPLRTLWNGSLRPYPLLETLSLRSCRLGRLGSSAFQAQGRLLSLGLADNRLAERYREAAAALRALRRLRSLDLSGNSLTEAMAAVLLRNLSSLEAVSLARNALMRLDEAAFEGLGRLRELDLQRNLLFEIEGGAWGGLAELRALNLAHNHLPCVAGFSLRRLRTLNLSSNALEWFLAAGGDAPFELELLDLSHNRLLFFPQLPPRSRLRTLLLRDNRVAFYRPLPRAAAPGDPAARGNATATAAATARLWDEISGDLSALRELDLGQNQLRRLPAGLLRRSPRLARLDLSRNCLSALRLGRAEPLRALAELDLSHNRLAELRVAPGAAGRLPSLRSANLRANRLRALPAGLFARAARLAAVDLSRNPVALCPPPPRVPAGPPGCVDLRNLASLRSLSLEGCGLRALPGRALRGTRLTHLDLSGNPGLLNGSLAPLLDVAPTLRVLSLRNVGLGPGAPDLDLAGFGKLRALDLSGNSLSRFPRLRAGEALRTLDLRRNALTALPPRAAARRLLQGLQTVYLGDNPYDCCGVRAWGGLEHLTSVADLAALTCNLSSKVLRVTELPAGSLRDCAWERGPAGLLGLVLVLPGCLTLLVAGAVVFLTFKKPLLQVIKNRCHWSSGC